MEIKITVGPSPVTLDDLHATIAVRKDFYGPEVLDQEKAFAGAFSAAPLEEQLDFMRRHVSMLSQSAEAYLPCNHIRHALHALSDNTLQACRQLPDTEIEDLHKDKQLIFQSARFLLEAFNYEYYMLGARQLMGVMARVGNNIFMNFAKEEEPVLDRDDKIISPVRVRSAPVNNLNLSRFAL